MGLYDGHLVDAAPRCYRLQPMTSRYSWVALLVCACVAGGCNVGTDVVYPGDGAGDPGVSDGLGGDSFVGDGLGGDSFVGDSAPPGDDIPCPNCNDTSECAAGGVCTADKVCKPHPQYDALCRSCSQSDPCPAGMGCVIDPAVPTQNYCVAACTTADDCGNGYTNCLGSPMPGPEPCSISTLCSGGRSCVNLSGQQFCECQSAADCDIYSGWACSVGECFTAPCTTDADCAPFGVTCNTNWGICSIPCSVDEDCICLNGLCAFSGVPCTTAADCSFDCAVVPVGGRNVGLCITESWFCSKQPGVGCNLLTGGAEVCPGL